MLDRREMVGLPARLRPYRFDRFGEALESSATAAVTVRPRSLTCWSNGLASSPCSDAASGGHEEAGRRILDDHHPVLRAQRVGAVQVTLRGGGERTPWLTHRLGGGVHARQWHQSSPGSTLWS